MNPADICAAYLAPDEFTGPLENELDGIIGRHGGLIFTDQPVASVFWAQNVWRNPQVIEIESINDAARKLKAIQRNWCLYPVKLHRRSTLIQEKLPHVAGKPLPFPSALPKTGLGAWTLLDNNLVLASADCSSLFPNGAVRFVEDKSGPPNRAYLKLWEALTLMQTHPQAGEFCLDFGGSPGGWAWTAARLGAQVLSIDRSELDPKVMALPDVDFKKGDAFKVKPGDFDRIDWLLWDVVCYPEKLFDWLAEWVESGRVRNIVATLKFQGDPDYTIARKFAALPGARVQHLYHNKHELTILVSGLPT